MRFARPRRGTPDRPRWVVGDAHVLAVTPCAPAPDRCTVTARLRTSDGQEVTGAALGTYPTSAQRWLATARTAWYDPADPRRFTLARPTTTHR